MEALARTCQVADPPLVTASRRFRGRHPVAIVFGWFWIHGLFYLGVSPDRLAGLYDSARRRRPEGAAQDRKSLRPQSYS